MKWILVGQGRTEWDDESRLQGTIDLPLSVRGRKGVSRLARKVHAFTPGEVVAGSGQTLVETARIYARQIGCRVHTHDELNELDHGLWQGMLRRELEERYPRLYRRWSADPQSVSPPRGEPLSAMLERVGGVLERLRRRRRDRALIVVLPRMVRLAAQARLTGVSFETIWSAKPSPGEWTGIDI